MAINDRGMVFLRFFMTGKGSASGGCVYNLPIGRSWVRIFQRPWETWRRSILEIVLFSFWRSLINSSIFRASFPFQSLGQGARAKLDECGQAVIHEPNSEGRGMVLFLETARVNRVTRRNPTRIESSGSSIGCVYENGERQPLCPEAGKDFSSRRRK